MLFVHCRFQCWTLSPRTECAGIVYTKILQTKAEFDWQGGGWLYAIIVLIVTTNKAKKFLTKVLKEGAVYGMI